MYLKYIIRGGMYVLKNDLSYAIQSEQGIISKVIGLGEKTIETAEQTNIDSVKENAAMYNSCLEVMQEYKLQLESDVERIRNLGTLFFDIDHGVRLH